MLSDPQTPGAADQAHPSIRDLVRTSVYPLSETGVSTRFARAPEVKLISVFKMPRDPEMKGRRERHAEMMTIIATIKRMTNLEVCVM